jgi:hypothetical protein
MQFGLNKAISAMFGNFGNREKGWFYERNCDTSVRRLQRTQLLDDQEQENYDRSSGVQEVLQALPQTHAAQRS